MKERIAIVGTGIAGMATAHFLRDRYDLTLYEKNDYIGGHTHTVMVDEEGREIPIDTGFMVYNETTYPHLVALFEELEVPTKPTDMSFGVQNRDLGLEWGSSGLQGVFAQRKNLLRPVFWRMLRDVLRFNKKSDILLEEAEDGLTIADLVTRYGYSAAFRDLYLVPMGAAIWSTEPGDMLRFPVKTLIRFFQNHGLLGKYLPWRTVEGGSREYRERLVEPFLDRIRTSCGAARVERGEEGVVVVDTTGQRALFDYVVIAAHADEALAMLATPSRLEEELLGGFRYTVNDVYLHTDERVMPRARNAWASWNYLLRTDADGGLKSSTHYWMNSLQGVSEKRNYFVSVNDRELVARETILQEFTYTHPAYDPFNVGLQGRLAELNREGRVKFCGSYFRYGFHEDALMSAIAVADGLVRREVVEVK